MGPTAVGKTDFCVALAQKLKTEIVSADSRQFYQELNIGTAKPTKTEMQGVPHHFVDSHSIADYYSMGDYERDAIQKINTLFTKYDTVILTGGSGMFVKAITHGLDEMPEIDHELREQLMNELKTNGLKSLAAKLKLMDPEYFESMDQKNSQRVVRALEVCIGTGQNYTAFRKASLANRPFTMIKLGLERDRAQLYHRIDKRMDMMLQNGLVDEAKSLLAYKDHYALQTVGYKEVYDYLEGQYDFAEMERLLKRNSRRYAKRQMTWFKNQDQFNWFDASETAKAMDWVMLQCQESL